jgi:hypothetical protein
MASQGAIRRKRKKWLWKLVLDFLVGDYANWDSFLELLNHERQESGEQSAYLGLSKSD